MPWSPTNPTANCTTCGKKYPTDTNNTNCKSCQTDELNMSYATSTQSINFDAIYSELQIYQRQNNNLTIASDHPSYGRIMDSLALNNVESALKKRWLQNLSLVKSLQIGAISNDSNDLGKWIQCQLDYLSLYREGLPHPLSRRQIDLLEEVGVEALLRLRGVVVDGGVNGVKCEPLNDFENEESVPNNEAGAGGNVSGESNSNEAAGVKMEAEVNGHTEPNNNPEDAIAPKIKDETQNNSINTNQTKEPNTKEPNTPTTIKGKCDVCRKKDKHQNHNLQSCSICNLKVHELCYGLIETSTKNPNFVCYACQSVNTQIEVNVPSRVGPVSKKNKREFITQKSRPTECALCSYSGGIHAMHPLMDTHGPEGRQLVLPKGGGKEKRLAWVHTLCATFICSNPLTRGCVYGLNEDNAIEDEGEVDDESEDQSEDDGSNEDSHHSEELDATTEETEKEDKICANVAYAIAGKVGPSYWQWTDTITRNRKYRCYICGEDDTKSTRIPVQCIVDEENQSSEMLEFPEFNKWRMNYAKEHHHEPEFLEGREANCSVAMHVGCARWAANLEQVGDKPAHLVYFYPGQQTGGGDGTFDEPVANCYCPAHARELILGNPKNRRKNDSGSGGVQRKRSSLTSANVQPSKRPRTNPQPKARTERKLPGPKKPTVRPKKNDKPFGRRDAGVALSEVRQEEFVVLGKAGRALSKRDKSSKTQNKTVSDSTPSVTAVGKQKSSGVIESSLNETQNQVKREDHSRMEANNKLNGIAVTEKRTSLTASVKSEGNSHMEANNKPIGVIATEKRSSLTQFPSGSATAPPTRPPPRSNINPTPKPSLPNPVKKPVGILRNKRPGPRIDNSSEVQANNNDAVRPHYVKQEMVDHDGGEQRQQVDGSHNATARVG